MDFEFTPQQEQVRETIVRFAADEMAALVRRRPREAVER